MMSRFYSYLNTAKKVLGLYQGELPFSAFLKNFFSKEKKYGSRDRREIAALCYNYFRTGFALKNKNIEERLLTGLFLSGDSPHELLQYEQPDWNKITELPLAQKLSVTGTNADEIFPFNKDLSAGIDIKAFNTSFLLQPKVFIRLRPGKKENVIHKLIQAQLDFEEVNDTCLSFLNGTQLEQTLDINADAVIQDLNSQRVGEFLASITLQKNASVWDCCAASGGKTIMAYDLLPGIALTVSDVRQSIIKNLHKRLKEAGIEGYQSFIADLTDKKNLQRVLSNKRFDAIICDAPCSGAGTWSRTPEQLLFFKQEQINRYSNLQKSIVMNAIPYLKNYGYFLYITCSVFKKENEEVVEFIRHNTNLVLIKTEMLKGYEIKADTMFVSLFQAV